MPRVQGGGGAAPGANLFVDPAGSDHSDSYTRAQIIAGAGSKQWSTIGRAAWGSTTRSSPNTAECVQPGDTVSLASATYTTSGLTIGAWGSDDTYRVNPLYTPAVGGTSGAKIRFVAAVQGGPVLQHPAVGGPTFGSNGKDYIIWDGFTLDAHNAPKVSDTAPALFFGCTGGEFLRCTVINVDATGGAQFNNNSLFYFENVTGCRLAYCLGHTIANASEQSQNDAGLMTYDCIDCICERNEFHNTGEAISLKGTHGGFTQTGWIVRYNLIYDSLVGVMTSGIQSGVIHQNIFYHLRVDSGGGGGIVWRIGIVGGTPNPGFSCPTNIDFYSNSAYDFASGLVSVTGNVVGGNVYTGLRHWNNIGSVGGYLMTSSFYDTIGDIDFQHDIAHSMSNPFSGSNPGNIVVLATEGTPAIYTESTWQSSAGQDDVSPVGITNDPLYANPAGHDFTLQGGSPALNMGRTFGGATINAGAYPNGSGTQSGNEVIGRG